MNTELLMFVLRIHAGQLRKGNREDGTPDPQMEHVMRVFCRLLGPLPHYPESLLVVRANATPLMIDVSIAHDVIEDAKDPVAARKELADLLHPYALQAVEALTHTSTSEEGSYKRYIQEQVLPNPLASLVKLADLEDNMKYAIQSLRSRYAHAKQTIMDHWKKAVFPKPEEDSLILPPGYKPDEKKIITPS
jgi:hypothetical protein